MKENLLEELKDIDKLNRDDVVPIYVELIRPENNIDPFGAVVKGINAKIITRWSLSALEYIKNKAWKIHYASIVTSK